MQVLIESVKNNNFKEITLIVKKIITKFDIYSKIKNKKNVIIKPNLCINKSFQTGATTDIRIVEALCKLLHNKCKLTIAEASGRGMNTENIFRDLGYYYLKKKYGVIIFDLKNSQSEMKDHIKIYKKVIESDFLINIPVIKTHVNTLVTLGMKNLMGCIPDDEKARFHMNGLDKSILNLNNIIKPDLTILGGVYAMDGNGPMTGNLKIIDTIIASDDVFLADYIATKSMGFKINDVGYLSYYYNKNKHQYKKFKRIKVRNLNFKKPSINRKNLFFKQFDKFTAYVDLTFNFELNNFIRNVFFFFKNKKPSIDHNLCDLCKICIKVCPEHTIDIKNKKLFINNKCKHCYICVEFCPKHALYLR